MNKKTACLALLFILALLMAGCSGASKTSGYYSSSPQPAQAVQSVSPTAVSIEGFMFNPSTITIKKGETITWTNDDSVAHTVTGTGFDSGALAKGVSYQHIFNDAGTFNYICSYHPYMKGQVVVQ